MLRSLRIAASGDGYVLRGSITPQKPKPSPADIDDLCGLFETKVIVTPGKNAPNSSTPTSQFAAKKVDEAQNTKENPNATETMPTLNADINIEAAGAPTRKNSRTHSSGTKDRFGR